MYLRTSLIGLGLLATVLACSDKGTGDEDDNKGGSASTGGKGSQAGTSNAGTSNTTAGTKANGGTDGGGTGNSTMAGAPSEGGSEGGSDVTKEFTFDTAVEGFTVQDSSAAEEVEPVLKADIMISHNDTAGEPDPGSLQLDIPFSAASQYVSTGVDIRPPAMRATTDPGPDLSGKTITAWVMVESGYGEAEDLMTAPGNAKLYAKSGPDYVYASAAVANLTEIGVWVKLTFEVDFPGYEAIPDAFEATDVREIGIQFDTNAASTTFAPAVVLIDSISY